MKEIQYDPAQQQAVEHGSGPLLCLAGPGSGKTTVITGRAAQLLRSGRVQPENLLVITFTQAAAREMEDRFYQLCPEVPKRSVLFSTFHALFFRILRAAYGYTSENIIGQEQKNLFFTSILKTLKYEVEDEAEFIAHLQSEIGLVKAEGMKPENYYPMNLSQDIFLRAYRLYEEMMVKENKIDFDDMQLLCYELLRARPDILQRWQAKFTYILVDEAQDTNLLQYKLICMLAAPQNNLMLVGDDDQSIYRFRGARPEILLNFPKDFPDVKKVSLGVNYRCADRIVSASERLIRQNNLRYDKQLCAAKGNPQGEIHIQEMADPGQEAREILKTMMRLRQEGLAYTDMAVLFRTNLIARQVVDELIRAGVPVELRDVIPNLYDHWIFRDIRTYIRIAMGSTDRADYLAIINRPKRYISRDSLPDAEVSLRRVRAAYADKPYVQERLDKLRADLVMLKTMRPYAAIHYIRHAIAYEDYVKDYAAARNLRVEDLLDVFDEIEEDAAQYKTYVEWLEAADRISAELRAHAAEKRQKRQEKSGVSVMTYHSAKGLEFHTCFLPSVNDGIIPYKKATTDADIEEERRMFYVALTRAARRLYISYTKKRYGKESPLSPFLLQIVEN